MATAQPRTECWNLFIRIGIPDSGPVTVMSFSDYLLKPLAVLKISINEQQSIERPIDCVKSLQRRPRDNLAAVSKSYEPFPSERVNVLKGEAIILARPVS